MKPYKVELEDSNTGTRAVVEVEANSKEEAIEKAQEKMASDGNSAWPIINCEELGVTMEDKEKAKFFDVVVGILDNRYEAESRRGDVTMAVTLQEIRKALGKEVVHKGWYHES